MTYPDNLQIWSKYHANNIKRKVGTLDICPFFWGGPFCCRRATIRNGDTTGMTGPKVACPSSAVWLARCSFYREKCAEGDAAQRTRQVYEEALKILGLHPGGGDGRMVIWMVVEWERRHGRVVNTLMGCIYVCIYIYICSNGNYYGRYVRLPTLKEKILHVGRCTATVAAALWNCDSGLR
jgi:hypothetical protein